MKILMNNGDPSLSLQTYLNHNAQIDSTFFLINPLPSLEISQRGETCKLFALANAIENEALKNNLRPLPLYKNRNCSQTSLRQLAKKNGSAVGEMYSIESLTKTAQDSGYISTVYAPYDEYEYIRQLEKIIEENKMPIIFYDIDLNPGDNFQHPYLGDGKNEHAAIIVGFYKTFSDETHFIVMQYNEFYDFNGMNLAFASLYSLSEQREPETFKKVQINDTTKWVLENNEYPYFTTIEGVPTRKANRMSDTDTPLKGKIMTVEVMKHSQIINPLFSFYNQNKSNFTIENKITKSLQDISSSNPKKI